MCRRPRGSRLLLSCTFVHMDPIPKFQCHLNGPPATSLTPCGPANAMPNSTLDQPASGKLEAASSVTPENGCDSQWEEQFRPTPTMAISSSFHDNYSNQCSGIVSKHTSHQDPMLVVRSLVSQASTSTSSPRRFESEALTSWS